MVIIPEVISLLETGTEVWFSGETVPMDWAGTEGPAAGDWFFLSLSCLRCTCGERVLQADILDVCFMYTQNCFTKQTSPYKAGCG